MSLGVAIIGCGDMGRSHAGAWSARGDARVVSVFDPDGDRAAALARQCGATASACLEDALDAAGVDVVSVCTPVCFHEPVACAAAGRGKHVLCEKPIALAEPQARRMIDAAREGGVKLAVSYQYRGCSRYRLVRQLFRSGQFGPRLFMRFSDVREVRPKTAMHRRSMNGGPVIDMAGHFFDLLRWITGDEPVSVYARGGVFGRGKARLAGIDDLAIDAAEIVVETAAGHVLNAQVHWGMPEGFAFRAAESFAGEKMLAWPEGKSLITRNGCEQAAHPLEGDPPGPTVRVADLVRAIQTDGRPEVAGEDGLAALRVSLAALRSIEENRAVRLS